MPLPAKARGWSLERREGWKVCGFAATGREAVEKAVELQPDVVVIDMTMPELNGLDAAIQIRKAAPASEILIFTGHQSEELIRQAFAAGVKSFVFKSGEYSLLVEAVESLARHKPYFTPLVSDILLSDITERGAAAPRDRPGSPGGLTPREKEIVHLLAEGNSNREIADKLGMSVRTAENHRASILRKLHLDSLADLVRYAIRNKMIEP
jgi:two-component system response regulator NreC